MKEKVRKRFDRKYMANGGKTTSKYRYRVNQPSSARRKAYHHLIFSNDKFVEFNKEISSFF